MDPMNDPKDVAPGAGTPADSSDPKDVAPVADEPSGPIVLPGDPHSNNQPGEVNVIFRGLFLFVDRNNSIDVLIPNMDMVHAYRAGNFLAETALSPRSMNQPYMLGGVLPGNAHFDEGAATVFHGYDYSHSLSSEQVHARILLPRPVRILSLRPTEQPLAARVDPLGIMHRKRFPCVHVLRYTTGDLSKVQFYPHELEPGRGIHTIKGVKDPDDRLKQFKNIHIVAEPDGDAALDREHPAMGMEKIAELIEGLQGALAMDPLKVTKPSAEEGDFKKLGFVAIELLTLKEVLNLMEKAGKTWRNGDPFKPGDESEPVNFPPFSCDPVILRP